MSKTKKINKYANGVDIQQLPSKKKRKKKEKLHLCLVYANYLQDTNTSYSTINEYVKTNASFSY